MVALIAIVLGAAYLFTEPLYTPTALVVPHQRVAQHWPRYIAHKSIVSGDYMGNTREAMEDALGSLVEGIEVDVRFSKDGIPFLFHDDTLEEITDGKGKPEDKTWDELRQLSYRDSRKSRLVSLEETLQLIGGKKFIFLDIKTSRIWDADFAKALAKLIQAYHLHETVIVESFNPFFLMAMRLCARDILVMYDITTNSQAMGEEIQTQFDKVPWILKKLFFQKQMRRIVRPDLIGPRWNLSYELMRSLIKNGYPLISWTVDDPVIVSQLFDVGVVGVQTNTPLKLMRAFPYSKSRMVSDAGGSMSHTRKIIHVNSVQSVVHALKEAKEKHMSLTLGGRRHSMGGQTLLDDSIHLDMLGLNHVVYHSETETITAGAGATWKKIQRILDPWERSVHVMQSDNIFTIGGSLSVNVHGWQIGQPPLSSTVLSLKVLMVDGVIRSITPTKEPELFRAILGGYGLFGIILEAEITTVPNTMLSFHSIFIPPKDFTRIFHEKVTQNPKAELAYGRLSVEKNHLFKEAGLFWYERTDLPSTSSMDPEKLVAMKRAIFRSSQYFDIGKTLRWSAEKSNARRMMSDGPVSRNTIMNTDSHILWPLYGKDKDVLHEYFLPKDCLESFLNGLKNLVLKHAMNLLNVTIREVKADTLTALPYATQDMFGFVLLFSQREDSISEKKMETFTQQVVDYVLNLGGTFYLPYRHHYTAAQLQKSYPSIHKWLALKKQWDPDSVLDSEFQRNIRNILY